MQQRLLLFLLLLLNTSAFLYAQKPVGHFVFNGSGCSGENMQFRDQSFTPVGTIVGWEWDFGESSITTDTSTKQNPSYIYTESGSYLPRLIVTNSIGNKDTFFSILEIIPSPIASISTSVPCFPNPIMFESTSTLSNGVISSSVWSIQTSTSSGTTYNYAPVSTGSYTIELTVKSDKGCESKNSETFEYGNKPTLSFSPSGAVTLCDGDSTIVNVSGATSYLWGNGNTTASNVVKEGKYHSVIGSISNQCFSGDSILVNLLPAPKANAGADITILLGESTTLKGSGGNSFMWSPSATLSDSLTANPIATPIETTSYILTVLGSNSCAGSDTVTVFVDRTTSVKVHNMITPNGDGHNDSWNLTNVPGIENASVHVFNRWGWEVYKSEEYKNNWKGTFNDQLLPDGTYLYVINFNDSNRESLRGALEIIRNTQK